MVIITRREALAMFVASYTLLTCSRASAQATDQWFGIEADDGKPVPNMRLPVEIASDVDELSGAIWAGSGARALTLVEFFDYNCPYCRKAAADLRTLVRENPDLRLGLVNNPILSPASERAARVEFAVQTLGGPAKAYEFHGRLFERRGVIDRGEALDVAAGLGAPLPEIARLADGPEARSAIAAQLRLAASLGMAATPSFMIGGAGLFGYPGPATLKRLIGSVRECGQVSC